MQWAASKVLFLALVYTCLAVVVVVYVVVSVVVNFVVLLVVLVMVVFAIFLGNSSWDILLTIGYFYEVITSYLPG